MADIKNGDCSCQTVKDACCTCVSFHCDKCKPYSKNTQYQAGSFCSACGRPVGEKGEPPLKTIERLNEEILKLRYEIELMQTPSFKALAQQFEENADDADDSDMIAVVRCKDCKFHREAHYEDEGEPPYIKHICKLYKRTMQLDDYCSYGEKKDEK